MMCNADVLIGLELGRLIQQTRTRKKMSQKDLAAVSAHTCHVMCSIMIVVSIMCQYNIIPSSLSHSIYTILSSLPPLYILLFPLHPSSLLSPPSSHAEDQ